MSKKPQKWVPTDRATFEAMDVVGKRKAIANDVLAGINAGILSGGRANVFVSRRQSRAVEVTGKPDALVSRITKCFVCGLGAPVVSAGRIADRMEVAFGDELPFGCGDVGNVLSYLSEWFPEEDLHTIEVAYESGGGAFYLRSLSDERASLAQSFSEFEYGTPRLKAIWEYVANHPEGLFEPMPG